MKKFLALCMALLLMILMVACDSDKGNDGDSGDDKDGGAAAEKIDYSVTYKGIKIEIGADAKTVLASLGEASSVEEGEACPGGIDTDIHTYSGLELMIYKDSAKNTETVGKISIINDTVATDKNITIGSTEDAVVEAYGKNYTKGTTGALCYNGEKSSIEFHFNGGKVSNIYVKTK